MRGAPSRCATSNAQRATLRERGAGWRRGSADPWPVVRPRCEHRRARLAESALRIQRTTPRPRWRSHRSMRSAIRAVLRTVRPASGVWARSLSSASSATLSLFATGTGAASGAPCAASARRSEVMSSSAWRETSSRDSRQRSSLAVASASMSAVCPRSVLHFCVGSRVEKRVQHAEVASLGRIHQRG